MNLRRRARRLVRQPSAQVSEQELQIRKGLEALRNSTAREVMTPRVDVVALPVPVTLDDVARAVRRSGHSHFPVYQDDLDHLLGVLFVKDLFHPGPLEHRGLGRRTPGTRPVASLSTSHRRFASRTSCPSRGPRSSYLPRCEGPRRAFAVVVDEYGGVAGVITINDLVSELVGDLRDEFDRSSLPAIERVDQSRYLVDGAVGVDEVRSELGIPIPDGDYVTLGGFVLRCLRPHPRRGRRARVWRMDLAHLEDGQARVAKVVMQAPAATMTRQGGTEH